MSAARRPIAALLTVFAAFVFAVELIETVMSAITGDIDIPHACSVLGLTAVVLALLGAACFAGRRG